MSSLSLSVISIAIILFSSPVSAAERMDTFQIYKKEKPTRIEAIKYPEWFKPSFFNLQEDLIDARNKGKRGIIVMLAYERCITCRAMMETTFSDPEIIRRLRDNYEVISMDIFSELEVTTPDGKATIVRDFAEQVSASLTPTLLFFGVENVLLVKIIGFYPPEKFNHVLDYIDGANYATMKLSEYLVDRRIRSASNIKLINRDTVLFGKPDYNLARGEDSRHLLVVFEHPDCNPCDRFHQRVLKYPGVRKKFPRFRAIQLDATDNHTRLILPDGTELTPKKWYDALQLTYDVVTVFFDKSGREVLRHDGEIGHHRMDFTMDYVLKRGYLDEKQVLRWRKKQSSQYQKTLRR